MALKLGTFICIADELDYLPWVVRSVAPAGPVHLFGSKWSWDGKENDTGPLTELGKALGAILHLGEYKSETEQRVALLGEAHNCKYDRILIPDSDEVARREGLEKLVALAKAGVGDRVYCRLRTFWYSPEYQIDPPEQITPIMMLNPKIARHVYIREYGGGEQVILSSMDDAWLHLSYSQPEGSSKIDDKFARSSHAREFIPAWRERVWSIWPGERTLERLHPTHELAFQRAVRRPVPPELADIPLPAREPVVPPARWCKISLVIPLYGHPELVARFMRRIEPFRDLIHEVAFADDASPDNAADEVRKWARAWATGPDRCQIKLVCSEVNRGFGTTCNMGYAETTSDIIVFANSDVILTKCALIRLVETLTSEGIVAAAGPMTNHASHHQQMAVNFPTLESPEALDLLSEDIATSEREDCSVDILIGFCLAVKRQQFEEAGLWSTQYGTGQYEDNCLSYKLRKLGYKLKVSGRAFVHHDMSASLRDHPEHAATLMQRNKQVFIDTYKEDLECGFASHLSGLGDGPIVFDHSRHPGVIRKEIKKLAKLVKLTIGVISFNEERVIRNLLNCITGHGIEIVLVDTISTDKTKEIAREFGIEPIDHVWENSFSAARNVTILNSTGRWLFYPDCDDTITLYSLYRLLVAISEAPPDVVGFPMQVQFTKDPAGDTVVWHCKCFRLGLPGVIFTHRIHEQIQANLQATGGRLVPLYDVVVQHSGYDYSEAGQRAKRVRDWPLLWRCLEDNPNDPFRIWNVGMTYGRTGEYALAVPWLAKCIEKCPPGNDLLRGAYSLLGHCLAMVGDVPRAIAELHKGLEVLGDDPEIRYVLAGVLSGAKLHWEAKLQLEAIQALVGFHSLSTDSGFTGSKRLHALAREHMFLGDYRNASETWRRNVMEYGHIGSALELADAALQMGDLRTARWASGEVLRRVGPINEWLAIELRLSTEAGEDPERFLSGALRTFPYALSVLCTLSDLLIARGRPDEAAPIFHERDRLGDWGGARNLAVMLQQQGRHEEALFRWKNALRHKPEDPEATEAIARLEAVLA